MNRIVVGVDIAKRVFQLHWVEPQTGEIVALQLKREKFLEHFANRANCLIGMEACGGSQHWARALQKLGHEVKLMSARMVKPFVGGNKNDVADARAIWTAVQQPGIKAVAVKSEAQQAVLALHRMREQLVKFRTAQINGLQGPAHGVRRSDAPGPSRHQPRYPGRFGAFGGSLTGDRDRDLARTVRTPGGTRRADQPDRAAFAPMAARGRGEPAYRGDPRCGAAECDRGGGHDGRCKGV